MIKIAVLFPGQGAQYPGMGKDICGEYPAARRVFERACDMLGRDICALTFEGPEGELNLTENTQPCLLTVEMAIMSVLLDNGIKPHMLAGFSLGEWAAVTAAGCLPFEDALRLVEVRAKAMQEASPLGQGAMAAVMGQPGNAVEELCGRVSGYVVPSNYNCPGQVTVGGEAAAVERLLAICEAEGITAQRLAVSIPSHCALMEPASLKLVQAMETAAFADADIPIVMNATGMAETRAEGIKECLIRQLTQPVRFEASLKAMLEMGMDTFVEVGPGKTLSGFVKRTAKAMGHQVNILQAGDMNGLEKVLRMLEETDGDD